MNFKLAPAFTFHNMQVAPTVTQVAQLDLVRVLDC